MTEVEPTEYYMLDFVDPDDVMMLRKVQPVGGINWVSGQRFTSAVPDPLYVDIVDGYEIDTVPRPYDPGVPMMRNDLLTCLRDNGVDNIDSYPIVIRNEVTGEDIVGYSAINIIGLVRAADAARTVYSADNPSRLLDADIDGLAIDSRRTRGLLLFRLAEAVTGVVVHERVKRAVEATGAFPDLRFIHPSEWMG